MTALQTSNQILAAWLRETKAPIKIWAALAAIKRGEGRTVLRWPEPGDRLTRTDEPSA